MLKKVWCENIFNNFYKIKMKQKKSIVAIIKITLLFLFSYFSLNILSCNEHKIVIFVLMTCIRKKVLVQLPPRVKRPVSVQECEAAGNP